MRSVVLILLLALLAQPSAGQRIEEFLECRELTDSLERLRCYDNAAAGAAASGSPEFVQVDNADPAGPPKLVPCPLRLEATLERSKIEREEGWTTGRFGAWECESTRVSALKVRVERRGNRVQIALTSWVLVRPSYDRLASLDYEILSASGASYPARLGNLDAEEGQAVSDTVLIRLSDDDYASLFGDGATARLRVTLRVTDNR